MKILLLTRYGRQGASSRVRSFQYLPYIRASGVECVVSPLFDDELLIKKYQHGSYAMWDVLSAYWRRILALMTRDKFDLVWIEKETLPWWPAWIEQLLLCGKPYMLDFDDAIFHNYDLHRSAWVRRVYGRRIDCLMAGAQMVIAGNRYLADHAIAAGARRVEVIPTVIDLARYASKQNYSVSSKLRIVWIGSPSTVQYLQELAEPLATLAKRQPFILRVISGGALTIPGVDVESIPWFADTEAALIAECDVGVMPLRDTPWEQGKCAYKLIQYMACGLPTVASPIGANRDVVIEGVTGFFADTANEWVEKMELLLCDTALRQDFGQAGRARVEAKYCLQQTAPKLVRLLAEAGGNSYVQTDEDTEAEIVNRVQRIGGRWVKNNQIVGALSKDLVRIGWPLNNWVKLNDLSTLAVFGSNAGKQGQTNLSILLINIMQQKRGDPR